MGASETPVISKNGEWISRAAIEQRRMACSIAESVAFVKIRTRIMFLSNV